MPTCCTHRRLLHAHVKQSSGSSAVYMLSGWTKDAERRHVVRLVAGGETALTTAKDALAEARTEYKITSARGGGCGVL